MPVKPKAYDAARAEARRYPGEKLVVVLFFAFMLAPLTANLFGIEFFTDNFEKRLKAKFPPFNLEDKNIYRFPRRFNEYFNDHFGLRDVMIRGYVLLKDNIMQASRINKVVLGEGDWLYYTYEYADADPMATYMGTNIMDHDELVRYVSVLNSWNEWLEHRSIPMLVMIPPNKASIYPEHLPHHIKPVRDFTRTDQIIAMLETHAHFPVADSRETLLAHKDEPLFYYTDTHWTQLGAFYAYQHLMERIADKLPEWDIRIPKLDDFEWEYVRRPSGDLARMLVNLDPTIDHEMVYTPKPLAIRQGPKPRLLFYGDSFSWALLPFLEMQFEVTRLPIEEVIDPAVIAAFEPDLFMFEVVERNAHKLSEMGAKVRAVTIGPQK
ncbi:MAG: DHHW family protein [Oceanidesulfovibrio sp.]